MPFFHGHSLKPTPGSKLTTTQRDGAARLGHHRTTPHDGLRTLARVEPSYLKTDPTFSMNLRSKGELLGLALTFKTTLYICLCKTGFF